LKPHFVLLALILASIFMGLVNLTWGVTTQYSDTTIAIVSVGWALVSAGLLGVTLLQILRRLHNRDEYRFRVTLAASMHVGTHLSVLATTEDLSVRGCSLLVDRAIGQPTLQAVSLALPDGALTLMAEVVHATSLADNRSRLGLRFRGLDQEQRERLVEFLFVTVARQQSQSQPVLTTAEPREERGALAA
jgi:hypothetical protein